MNTLAEFCTIFKYYRMDGIPQQSAALAEQSRSTKAQTWTRNTWLYIKWRRHGQEHVALVKMAQTWTGTRGSGYNSSEMSQEHVVLDTMSQTQIRNICGSGFNGADNDQEHDDLDNISRTWTGNTRLWLKWRQT